MTRTHAELVGEIVPEDVLVDLFQRHDADGDEILEHARRLDRQAGDVDNFDADLTTSHNTAKHGVAGLLTSMLEGADKPTKAAGKRLVQRTVSAAATLTLFGHQVNDFNRHVREWNQQIRARETRKGQLEERERLRPHYRQAAERMEDRVESAARMLRHPLDKRTIKKLHRVGVLPLGIENLFPSVKLSARERAESVDNRIERGFMPDVAKMLPADLDAWMRKHPDVASAVPAMLAVAKPSPAIEALAGSIARRASDLVRRGLEGPPGADSLRLIERGTKQLDRILDITTRDGDHGGGDHDGDSHGGGHGGGGGGGDGHGGDHRGGQDGGGQDAPGARDLSGGGEAYVEAFLDNLGTPGLTGLTAAVDAGLAAPDAGGPHADAGHGGHEPLRPGQYTSPVAEAVLALSRTGSGDAPEQVRDLPQPVQEALALRPGQEADTQALRGWSALLHSAPQGSEPGGPLAYHLAEQAVESKPAAGEGDGYLSNLLSVAARSEDGSSRALLDDHLRPALMTADWDDAEGAQELVRSGTDRHADGGGHQVRQAEAAHVLLSEVAADPRGTVERLGEPMQNVTIGVGLRWADSFGLSGGPDGGSGVVRHGPDLIGPDAGPRVRLDDAQIDGFMDYAAHAGPWDAVRFQAGLMHRGDDMIAAALDPRGDASPHERADALKSALAWSGLADGRMHAAMADAPDPDGRETAALLDASRRSPYVPEEPRPGQHPVLQAEWQEVLPWSERFSPVDPDVQAARDYRFASIVADQYADRPQYADLFTRDGDLRPLASLSDVDRSRLGSLADNVVEGFNEQHPRISGVSMATYGDAYQSVNAPAIR